MNLSTQALEFRAAYQISNSPLNRETQKCLIDEEYKEFCQAHRKEPNENILKELNLLSPVSIQSSSKILWQL